MRPLGRVVVSGATRPVRSGPMGQDPAQASRAERMCAMRYRLVPGLLAEQQIEYDDVQQKLLVDLYLVPLSPTQYRLVMVLLRQRQRWKERHEQAPLFVSVRQLMQVARLTKPASVMEQMSRAAERLAPYQIIIGCLHGWGYGVFSAAAVPALALVNEARPNMA